MTRSREEDSWSGAYARRREVRARFGSHFDLPLRRNAERVVAEHLAGNAEVLDVGAHGCQFREKVEKYLPGLAYESLDPDPANPHDYRSLDEVKKTFDGVYLFEVLEHVAVGELGAFLQKVQSVTRPGGLLFATVPCVQHPGRFLRDATHLTPLAYDELGGRIQAAGFELEALYRIYNAPWHAKTAHVYLGGWLHRFLDVDYATSVMAVARRKEEAS
jgi:SAM-dependent methyltransferase